MASKPLPAGVTVSSDRNSISATIEVDAPAAEVFEFLCRPANHARLSGDGTVKASRSGPDRLSAVGDAFGMDMKLGVPYRMSNKVTEYEADRTVAWATMARHTWRWRVEPLGDDKCRVTETFDLSTSPVGPALRLLGFPKRHQNNVAQSVANVSKMVAEG